MSHFTDARTERAAEARRRAGAPPGPRLGHVIQCDQEGQLTIYTGKVCSVCALPLTSRNRYGQKLLCIEHGREADSARVRRPKVSKPSMPRTGSSQTPTATTHLQALFRAWLVHPADERLSRELQTAMDDHELKERLRRLLPPAETRTTKAPAAIQAIPVEEITFTNPNHRTTHGEFLADADHYGV